MPPAARRALIAGLGLLGGSIGIALRRRGWRVAYLDPHVALASARGRAAADERVEMISETDLVILATPVDAALDLLRTMPPIRATSVCSVLQPLRALADGRSLPFVAGHPLAGSHERGLAAARADLFEGKRWFIDAEDVVVHDLIRDCGAIPDRIDPAEHDRVMALTSHLPQVLSTALAALAAGEEDVERFAGGGLRTFLRLAGSDASIWAPVLAANRDNIRAHFGRLVEIARAIIEEEPGEAFERAQRLWAELSAE